ncbi:TAXI family TRAP transporter solute-binding subunit [Paraburkholderia xenovorans]|uniref:TAXI family TRAP transporter solute-binding subunit n=1 Tax=Paraburkholderia xenovorans TaxID=36873 RepID=UPI0038B757F4
MSAGLLAGCAGLKGTSMKMSSSTRLSLGTSPPGGGFTPYGDAFAATVNEFDPAVTINPEFTKGSTENIPLIEAGKLSLGLAGGEPTFEALAGIGRAPAPLRIISPMYSSAGMFIVPGASSVRSISDLKGKPVVFGAVGSGLVVLARYVLNGMGLDMQRDFDAILLERDDEALGMLADGRAAALWGGGIGWPAFEDLSKTADGARFVVPNGAESAAILGKYTFLKQLTVPVGTYSGQTVPIVSIGSWSVVLAHAELDDDIAYNLAKAVHRGEASMAQRVASGRESLSANTWIAAPKVEYIHAGVRRYLRDAGIVAPTHSTA